MRKLKYVMFVLVMLLNTGLYLGLSANNASARDLDFEIRETIEIPAEHSVAYVRHVGDLDDDGNLDIVYIWYCTGCSEPSAFVIERDGDTFVPRYTLDGYVWIVAEVDGDNYPEILVTYGRYTAKIFEATGDNTYALRHTMNFGNHKIEPRLSAGDSDGDGKGEFLIPAEWEAIRIYEATDDNTYSLEETLLGTPGGNGNVHFAGVYDLDGDGHPETVFAADPYSAYSRTLYVFTEENGNRTQIYYSGVGQFGAVSLGDLDGNGIGEIIGVTTYTNELIIYESQGPNDDFQIVYQAYRDPTYPYRQNYVIDFDEDGQSELWRPIDDSNPGQLDVFTLAHRNGGTIIDFYNSGALLQSFSGDIRGLLAIGDTNADGGPELAVVQGNNIHILEQVTNEPPVADAGPDQTVNPGQIVEFDGSSSYDPDENYPLIYAWSIISRPAGSTASLANANAVNPSFAPDAPGDYTIELMVSDSEDLTSETDTAIVTVLTPQEATQTTIDDLQNIVDNNPGTPLADKVADARAKIDIALAELGKPTPDDQAAVGNIEGAVGDLEAAVEDGLLDSTQGTQLMDQLAGIARHLAVVAIQHAEDQGGDQQKIYEAEQALDEGDTFRQVEEFKDAVNKYKDALAKAENVLP